MSFFFTDVLYPRSKQTGPSQTEEGRDGWEEGGGSAEGERRGASCQPALLSHGQLVKAKAGRPWRERTAAESANHSRALGIPQYSSP